MKRAMAVMVLLAASVALVPGQSAKPATGQAQKLRPPVGYKVALVVFEDLQCPDCGRAEPLLEDAQKVYGVPIVRRDFPLEQMHKWARPAAIYARFFDSKGKDIGEQFRRYIFQNQPAITPENLKDYVDKFAAEKKIEVPFMIDPNGTFAKQVDADKHMGETMGVSHTPTIYVVTTRTQGTPVVEVVDRNDLFGLIDDAIRAAGGVGGPAKARTTKTAKKK